MDGEDIQPSGFSLFLFGAIMIGWILAIGEELIFDHYNASNICERAAVEPKTYRDVARDCGLGEFRRLPADPNEE